MNRGLLNWPIWWDWELEITPHVETRMEERDFTEIDLRTMLDRADAFEPDEIEGRYMIQTRHRREDWRIIVEPDENDHLLVVITAFSI